MPRKPQEEWITTREAARILTEKSGREITTDYVRRMGNLGKFDTKKIDKRTKLFLRKDVEGYTVAAKQTRPARGAVAYSEEQRLAALRLVAEGMSHRQAAKELGISYQAINNWVKQQLMKAVS